MLWEIGLLTVFFFTYQLLAKLYQYTLRRPLDLQARYGVQSWALITGGSEGIGQAFAQLLAEWGFNVLLLARSETKLKQTAAELRGKYPNVRVETVALDCYSCRNADFVQKLEEALRGKDLSVLVNNVGISWGGDFLSMPLEQLLKEVVLCDEATLIVTKSLLPRLMDRAKRSGLVFNSGLTAIYPAPGLAVHSGTKAFEHYLADALQYELRTKVDVLSLLPAAVCSSRLPALRPNLIASSPADVAYGALRDLGQSYYSYGTLKHAVQAWGLAWTPRSLRLWALGRSVEYMVQHYGL